MKYYFQRGKGSSWWAWWKSDKSFTQAFHFSIRLWETHWNNPTESISHPRWVRHKPLTPRLREGPIITLLSCWEEREGKAADGEAKATPRTREREVNVLRKKGRDQLWFLLLFPRISTWQYWLQGSLRTQTQWTVRPKILGPGFGICHLLLQAHHSLLLVFTSPHFSGYL